MMDGQAKTVRLTPVSYIVLGLLERCGEATPYALKGMAEGAMSGLWSVQHAQLYTEPERLAAAGLLAEEREEGGRRRKTYRLTDAGREALRDWLRTPATEMTELRDPGLLQLFFGAEPGPLARAQLEIHEAKLAEYEALHAASADSLTTGGRLALESGIGHEREWVRFWSALADG
jgi:PadR family transcriptional regulator, regulatory protein AphA